MDDDEWDLDPLWLRDLNERLERDEFRDQERNG